MPFVALFGWSGRWDDLPAAHAASVVFDLLALVLCFLLGRRCAGRRSASRSRSRGWPIRSPCSRSSQNTNDALVAVLVLAAVLLAVGTA